MGFDSTQFWFERKERKFDSTLHLHILGSANASKPAVSIQWGLRRKAVSPLKSRVYGTTLPFNWVVQDIFGKLSTPAKKGAEYF